MHIAQGRGSAHKVVFDQDGRRKCFGKAGGQLTEKSFGVACYGASGESAVFCFFRSVVDGHERMGDMSALGCYRLDVWMNKLKYVAIQGRLTHDIIGDVGANVFTYPFMSLEPNQGQVPGTVIECSLKPCGSARSDGC